MRARIKAELIAGDSSKGTNFNKGIQTCGDFSKNNLTTKNIELIKETFWEMGFDFMTRDHALVSIRNIRRCVSFIEKRDGCLIDTIQMSPFIIPVIEELRIRFKEVKDACSIDIIIAMKNNGHGPNSEIDTFISSYIDILFPSLLRNFDFLSKENILFEIFGKPDSTIAEIDFKIFKEKALGMVKGFAAYIDALSLAEDIPDNIHEKEINAWVLTAYEDNGQVSIMVILHNSQNIYFRIKANLFRKMKQGCEIILDKTKRHQRNVKAQSLLIKKILLFLRSIFHRLVKSDNRTIQTPRRYIKLSTKTQIQVFEPKRHHATIRGTIFEFTPTIIYENYKYELMLIAILSFATIATIPHKGNGSFYGFFNFISNFYEIHHDMIGRINTGFFVTLFVNIISLTIRVHRDKKASPVIWTFDSKGKP